MIIRIVASTGSIGIDDPKNFKAFALRIEGALDDPGFGWIDPVNHAIRAHIEYAP